MLFKVVFLQFLYDPSDREVEEQVNLHLACKWFAGLPFDVTQGRELAERQAKADLFRLPQALPDTPSAPAPDSPDPDASFGRSERR